MTTVVDTLEEILDKAKTGEISSVVILACRKGVSSGAVAYIGIAGDDRDNVKILNALRLMWQQGRERWNWPPFGVDQDRLVNFWRSVRRKHQRRA
jgi:hypothetical protein